MVTFDAENDEQRSFVAGSFADSLSERRRIRKELKKARQKAQREAKAAEAAAKQREKDAKEVRKCANLQPCLHHSVMTSSLAVFVATWFPPARSKSQHVTGSRLESNPS